MSNVGNQVGSFVIGGLMLGFWGWWSLFEDPTWGFWGFMGLAIAAALYGARVASDWARVVMFVLVGIFLGALLAAALLEQQEGILATFVTGVGAGLIAAALPRPGHAEDPPAQQA